MKRMYHGRMQLDRDFSEIGRIRQVVIGLGFGAGVVLIVCFAGTDRREGYDPGVWLGVCSLALSAFVCGPRRVLHALREFWREYGL